MKTIIVHHRSSHHAQNSGYSRLIDFLPETTTIFGTSKLPYRIAKVVGSLNNQKAGIYNSSSVFKEIELFQELRKDKISKKTVHYLNAERDIRFLLKKKKYFSNSTFFGTFHKPPTVLKDLIADTRYIKKLDGVIAVGNNQVEFLKNWLEIENVKYIPHGVDSKFFTPATIKDTPTTLLFVGQHLRDFEALNFCVPKIAAKVKGLKVNVILNKEYFKFINPHPSINLLSNINDEQLKNYYQEASVLFLPLKDSTACNSILEAMACGLPIITTDVGGNSEYLRATNTILAPYQDYDYLIEATIDVLTNEDKRRQLQKTTRDKALEYDWNLVAKQMVSFYNQ